MKFFTTYFVITLLSPMLIKIINLDCEGFKVLTLT
jgi:hypothetical protein